MSSRVEGRFLAVKSDYSLARFPCVQCGSPARLMLDEPENCYPLCPEDAIDLALELVREAKAAMKEEKKREVVR